MTATIEAPSTNPAGRFWLASYPDGMAGDIAPLAYSSIGALVESSCAQYASRPAFTSMGKTLTFRDFDAASKTIAAWLQANLSSPELCLIDARGPDRFRGENEVLDPVGGHIPGARNRFFRDNLDARGCFKQASVLREEFTSLLGAHTPRQVVHQCGSGVTACVNLLAMESAGLTGSRLYAGSWSEWCADPELPVARGPA